MTAIELMRSLQKFELLNPRRTKSSHYIALKFLGAANRAVLFQSSELMFL